jgi:hypothetical protein
MDQMPVPMATAPPQPKETDSTAGGCSLVCSPFGLGLAMVYGVVQRHSADLEIESTPGNGTTVRLRFAVPIGVADDLVLFETTQPVPTGLRILVVDDDPLIIRALCETLESDGHEVITANGGQAGIDAFCTAQGRGKPFSIVITDLGMPRRRP